MTKNIYVDINSQLIQEKKNTTTPVPSVQVRNQPWRESHSGYRRKPRRDWTTRKDSDTSPETKEQWSTQLAKVGVYSKDAIRYQTIEKRKAQRPKISKDNSYSSEEEFPLITCKQNNQSDVGLKPSQKSMSTLSAVHKHCQNFWRQIRHFYATITNE